jgi:hypothetical protein
MDNKHLDLIFIWNQLRSKGAVDFVYSIKYYGPPFVRDQLDEVPEEVVLSAEQLKQIFENELSDLISFHSNYESAKQELLSYIPNMEDIYSDGENPFVELRDQLDLLNTPRTNQSLAKYTLDPESTKAVLESTKQGENEEDIGSKRARLKNRKLIVPSSRYSKNNV